MPIDEQTDGAAITAAVFGAIAETAAVPSEKIAAEQTLETDLHIDSLDFVRLIQAVEERLDIVLSDESAVGVVTVGDLVAVTLATVAAQRPTSQPKPVSSA